MPSSKSFIPYLGEKVRKERERERLTNTEKEIKTDRKHEKP